MYNLLIAVRSRGESSPSNFARELVDFYQAPAAIGRQIYFVESYWILDYGIYDRYVEYHQFEGPLYRIPFLIPTYVKI